MGALLQAIEDMNVAAWPSSSIMMRNGWMLRLEPRHPARRLNSLNALACDMVESVDEASACLAWAEAHFARLDIAPTFRWTPLASPAMGQVLDRRGWQTMSETDVMAVSLPPAIGDPAASDARHPVLPDGARVQISSSADADWMHAFLTFSGSGPSLQAGVRHVVSGICLPVSFVSLIRDEQVIGTALLVQDRQMMALFEVTIAPALRGQGWGGHLMQAVLGYARARASLLWLQVVADNQPAVRLYRSCGFEKAYSYHYRVPA